MNSTVFDWLGLFSNNHLSSFVDNNKNSSFKETDYDQKISNEDDDSDSVCDERMTINANYAV